MRAFHCTYDEYLDTPNEAVDALLKVHRAINQGQDEHRQAEENKARAAQAAAQGSWG